MTEPPIREPEEIRQGCYVSAYLSAKVSLWRSRGVANLDGVGGRAAPGGG